jgi:hypothetical protein
VGVAGAQDLKLPWHMITSDSAANAKPVQTYRKDGINISLGLVTFARRPQALAIDRLKPLADSQLSFNRAAVLACHFHRLALRGDILTEFL